MKIRATKMMSIIPRSLLMACMITMMLAADDVHRNSYPDIETVCLQNHRGGTLHLEYNFQYVSNGKAKTKSVEYALCVPKGFEAGKKMPLVVALHGIGAEPHQFATSFQSAADQYGYLVLCPMGFNTNGWYGAQNRIRPDAVEALKEYLTQRLAGVGQYLGGAIEETTVGEKAQRLGDASERDVIQVINKLKQHREVEVDECRTYLLGYSMGGAGAWHLGMLKQWAAVGFVAPAVPNALTHEAEVVNDLAGINRPMICIQGSEDKLVDAGITRRIFAKSGARYHEIDGADHQNVWSRTYGIADGLFQFFGNHRNNSYERDAPFEVQAVRDSWNTHYANQIAMEELKRSQELWRKQVEEQFKAAEEKARRQQLKAAEEEANRQQQLKAAEEEAKRQQLINERQRQMLADEEVARNLDAELRRVDEHDERMRQQRLKAAEEAERVAAKARVEKNLQEYRARKAAAEKAEAENELAAKKIQAEFDAEAQRRPASRFAPSKRYPKNIAPSKRYPKNI